MAPPADRGLAAAAGAAEGGRAAAGGAAGAELQLHGELSARLGEYRAERGFDPARWVDGACRRLNAYMAECGLRACVVSVSGGVDSAVATALCTRARAMSGSPIERVIGLCQPIHSSPWALARGRENIAAAGAEEAVVDQTGLETSLAGLVEAAVGAQGGAFARGQLRSYMRTPAAYYAAQLATQQGAPCIVMGTGNRDEDMYLGYFCKAGDGMVDVHLLLGLHKSEVFLVGRHIGVPRATLEAQPSSDLWPDQTHDGELGFTSDFVELLIGVYEPLDGAGRERFAAGLCPESRAQLHAWRERTAAVRRRNAHKFAGVRHLSDP